MCWTDKEHVSRDTLISSYLELECELHASTRLSWMKFNFIQLQIQRCQREKLYMN